MTALSTGAGEYGIYRDTGTPSPFTLTVLNSWHSVEWDTTVTESDTDVIEQGEAGSLEQINLKVAGWYLLGYNLELVTSTTLQYQSFEGRLTANGTAIQQSHSNFSKNYLGATGIKNSHLSNVCLYQATAGDIITTEVQIAGNNINAGDVPTEATYKCGLTVLKLNDNWGFCELSITTGGQALTNDNANGVEWNEATTIDANYFTWAAGSPTQLTVEPGWYMSIGSFGITDTTAGQTNEDGCSTWLKFVEPALGVVGQSGGGGMYINRAGVNNFYNNHACLFENPESSAKSIELYAHPITGSGGVLSTTANGGKWFLVKLPDGIDESVLALSHDADDRMNIASSDEETDFNAEEQKGSHYSHSTSTGPDNVTINTAGVYLFLTGLSGYCTTGARCDWRFSWRENSTAKKYSNFGCFAGRRVGMTSCFLFHDAAESDVIDIVRTVGPSVVSAIIDITAEKHGISAIYLTTLFQAAPTITSITPAYGDIAGSEKVQIIGTGFNASTTVTFDADAATVIVNSTTRLTVLTPAHAAGYVDVVVNNGLSVTEENAFQYLDYTSNVTGTNAQAAFPSANGMVGATVYLVDETNYRIWSGTITSNTGTSWTVSLWTPLFNATGYAPSGTLTYYIGYIYLFDRSPYYAFSKPDRYGGSGNNDTMQKTLNRIEFQTNKLNADKEVYTNMNVNHGAATHQDSFTMSGDYSYLHDFDGRHRNFQLELALLAAEEVRIKEITFNMTWEGEGVDQ